METLPYYILLFAVAAPALAEHARKPTMGWVLCYLLLLLFVGLRYRVGSDWEGYLILAHMVEDLSLTEVLELGDPLFYLVLWSSVSLGLDVYGANLVTSAIFLLGLFKFCRNTPQPWLALYSALPFLVIVVGMSANRQAAAIGVTLYLLATWDTSSTVRRLALVAISVGFHASAFAFVLLFVIDSKISRMRKIIGAIIVVAVTAYFAASSSTLERYTDSYIGGTEINVASGALQQVLLNAIPAVFLLLGRRTLAPRILKPNFVFPMAILSILLIPAALFYSVAAARISFYLFPVSISLFAAIPTLSIDGRTRGFLRYMVVLYGIGLLAGWLTLAYHAYNHKPYGNFLFV